MERPTDTPINFFSGEWEVAGLYIRTTKGGWKQCKTYNTNIQTWTFIEERILNFYMGNSACEGTLTERSPSQKELSTKFAYYPQERKLFIDRSAYAEDGFCEACINEKYRVEPVSLSELWLYNLEDVGNEPEDYMLRVKMRRVEY